MKKLFNLASLVAVLTLMLASSCTSYKNVPYMQNSDSINVSTLSSLYDAKIMPKDQLTITVNCPEDPNAAKIFNLVTQTNDQRTSNNALSTQQVLQTYLVNNEGDIEFPILGKMHVAGMTKSELENHIATSLTGTYLTKRPIVLVNMANFHVSIAGEVKNPGVYTVSGGKINILEALAKAGDLTIYGQRENVKIIREDANGQKTIHEVNLNDARIINSPYYQLQQNDYVYVTPNKTKAKNSGIGSETSLWFTSISIVISLASLMYNIFK